MITFETETGSLYQVDDGKKRVRRVVAGTYKTVRLGQDWRLFDHRTAIEIGNTVLFLWPASVALLEGSPVGSIPMTETSRVIEVSP